MKIKLLIYAATIILAAVFIYLTLIMLAQSHLNSLMAQLSQGYQKTHVIPGHGEIGIGAVKASCGMASLKDEFSDMKITMNCHDSNQVKIHIDSFKGVPMKDLEATWTLPKQ